jgi:adenylosuccinate synthase
VVLGLGFGDEGKGSVVDWLCRRHGASLVVRFNGGPQAGHNVVTPEGTWHCFAQMGAGLLVPGTRSVGAATVLVELEALQAEARALEARGLERPLARHSLDPAATLITPFHKMLGQMREIARPRSTCGMGVGQAVRLRAEGLALRLADLASPGRLKEMLEEISRRAHSEARALLRAHPSQAMREVYEYFRGRSDVASLAATYATLAEGLRLEPATDVLARARGPVLFEGAQGALLDCQGGFRPYVTSSPTTWRAAGPLLPPGARRIGVLRAFAHRHGRGPLVTETAEPALQAAWADPRNPANRWQGPFRVGWLDLVALRYGLALNQGVDELALTHLDGLAGLPRLRLVTSYLYRGDLGRLEGFTWERRSARQAVVTALPAPGRGADLTAVLERCQPFEEILLPGFGGDLSGVRRYQDLPEAARALVEFLESPRGLGVPVGLVSVGPTAEDKIERHPAAQAG